jgi:hypothetical protein
MFIALPVQREIYFAHPFIKCAVAGTAIPFSASCFVFGVAIFDSSI